MKNFTPASSKAEMIEAADLSGPLAEVQRRLADEQQPPPALPAGRAEEPAAALALLAASDGPSSA